MSIDRRTLIVDAAHKSFALFGYKGTTMDQVAKIANVGKGTIYTFFSNKEELFQEVLNHLLANMKQVVEQSIKQGLSFFDALSDALNAIVEFRERHELALKIAQEVREIGTPMAIEAIQQIEKLMIAYIAEKVERAIEREEIKRCDSQLTAFIIIRLYMAIAVEWNHQKELDKSEVAKQLRFYLENGLAL